jgi:flagellar FliL protein
LVLGGVAGAYFLGYLDPLIEKLTGKEKQTAAASVQARETVFMDLPELLVNLNTGGRRAAFIKMKVTLEVDKKEHVPVIEKLMPRIIDNFQVYLRELKIEDLRGSIGMYRLREEMLLRANTAAAPAQVNDVLFKEILIQ